MGACATNEPAELLEPGRSSSHGVAQRQMSGHAVLLSFVRLRRQQAPVGFRDALERDILPRGGGYAAVARRLGCLRAALSSRRHRSERLLRVREEVR